MNSKIIVIILAVMVGAIAILGWKVKSASVLGANSNSGESISLSTNPNPLRLGQATFMIDVKDKSGKPVDNATVSYDINMTTMNMGTQQGNATPQGNGIQPLVLCRCVVPGGFERLSKCLMEAWKIRILRLMFHRGILYGRLL